MSKVSVIIPVYNTEKYLRECLDSVVNQTLKDIEIICINDGSTDNSLSILKEYAQNDKRITVFDQQNQGAAMARNRGIETAKGDYLLIFDSDDIMFSDMCEKMYYEAVKNNTDITICHSIQFNTETGKILPSNPVNDKYLPDKEVFNYKDIKEHIYGFCIGWAWDKLYKRDFVESNGLRFQSLKCSNDMYFVFYSLVLADRISVTDDILVNHRENVQTSVSRTRDKNPEEFIKAIYLLKQTLEDMGIYEEVKRSFINWNLSWCLWHIRTLKVIDNKKKLEHRLKKEVFKELDVYSYDKAYFYDSCVYDKIHGKYLCTYPKWYQNIFCIKNVQSSSKVHKVITICGLKLKFRNKKKEREIAAKEQRDMLYCIKAQNDSILKYLEQGINFETSPEKEKEICKK